MSKNSTDIKRGKLGSCEFLRQGFKSIRLGSEKTSYLCDNSSGIIANDSPGTYIQDIPWKWY